MSITARNLISEIPKFDPNGKLKNESPLKFNILSQYINRFEIEMVNLKMTLQTEQM